MDGSLYQQGTDLLLFGMGTVFLFLTLLVAATTVMSFIVQKYFPEPEEVLVPIRLRAQGSDEAVNPRHLAAIQAAIEQHRSS